jgi:DNA-directed RNA polymerase subunit D
MTAAGKKVVNVAGESKMEVRLLEKTKDGKLSFLLKNSDVSYANTIRRLMIEEVPVMAIEDVEFRENSSALYDEILAHRLGLIPLKTDLKSYNLPEECSCKGKGCAKCTLKITLSVKGPGMVYASDMKSKDPKIKPVFPKTPLVELFKDQKIKLEATAVLGKGIDHSKFSPGLFFYKNKPIIGISKECDNCGMCIESCPKNIFVMKNKKIEIDKDKLLDCHLCNACVDICPKKAVTVEADDKDIIFNIESFGQLSPREIVVKVVDIFDKKLKEFDKLLK